MQQCVRGLSLFHLSIVFLFFLKKKMNGQMIDSVCFLTLLVCVLQENIKHSVISTM